LTDYENLWFKGLVESGPAKHQYVLSSRKEAIAYCCSATAKENVKFDSRLLKLKDLSLSDGNYTADIIKPDKGILKTQNVAVKGGSVSLKLPAFVDDIAVHIYGNTL